MLGCRDLEENLEYPVLPENQDPWCVSVKPAQELLDSSRLDGFVVDDRFQRFSLLQNRGLLVRMERPETKGVEETAEQPVCLVSRDLEDRKVSPEVLGYQDPRACQGTRESKVSREKADRREKAVLWVLEEFRVLRELLGNG